MLEVGPTCSQVHGHKRLDDDVTENVKLHLRLHGIRNMLLHRVEGVKMRFYFRYFQGRIFYPTNLLNHVTPFIELMMQT